jgi:hypothetical protein
MPGLDVQKRMTPADLGEFEEYARSASRTIDQCHAWARAKGYTTLSRSSIYNWTKWLARSDRAAEIVEASRAIMDAAKEKGTAAVADAAILQLSSMIFEKTLSMEEGGKANAKDLLSLSWALKNVVMGKRYILALRAEVGEALKAAEKQRATPEQLTAKIRAILGSAPSRS